MGPTLVQLEVYFSTSTHIIVWLFTSYAIGGLLGTALSGLAFDRFNQELQMGVFLALGGVCFSISPFIHSLNGMFVMMGAVGMFLAYIDSG